MCIFKEFLSDEDGMALTEYLILLGLLLGAVIGAILYLRINCVRELGSLG